MWDAYVPCLEVLLAQSVLYYNGRIVTLDPRNPSAEALAVSGGWVLYAGTRDRCRSLLGPGAEEVDLSGAWILPGFTDSHIHFTAYARSLREVSLEDTTSLEEAVERVRDRVATLQPGEWVLGGNFDYNRWAARRPPEKGPLDAVAPENPAALHSRDGHSLWANSRALELAGITANSSDPASGHIGRLPDGDEPSGFLQESAQSPVWDAAEQAPRERLTVLLREAFPPALAAGITSIHDFDGTDAIDAYRELHAAGELGLRVYKSIPAAALDSALEQGYHTGEGDEWFRTGPVKIFTDGALGSHSAAMLAPFAGDPGNTGIEVTPPAQLQEMLLKACGGGIACALHAIGDRANRNALDAFERTRREGVGLGLRHRIEHVQHLHADDLPRLAALDVIASVQPIHQTSDMFLADELLGDRARLSYAWRSLLDSGARLAFGSDCPVEPFDPFLGLYAAVTRQREGRPQGGWYPHERLTAEEAVRAYTEGAAWASGEERVKGRLAPGMVADFVLLSENPIECQPDKIPGIQVLATYVGGREVYRA